MSTPSAPNASSAQVLRRQQDAQRSSANQLKQKFGLRPKGSKTYEALKSSLKLSVESLGQIPVPGLRTAGMELLALLKAIDNTIANQEQLRRLGAQVDRLLEYIVKPLLSQVENGDMIPETLRVRIETFGSELDAIATNGQRMLAHNAFRRFLLRDDLSDKISSLINQVSEALNAFLVMGIIQLDRAVNSIDKETKELGTGIGNVNKKLTEIDRTLLQNVRDGTPETLPYVPARYKDQRDNKQISICLPNTRVELLRLIDDWTHDRNKPPIFWLSGMAGTGKSTIAKTFAQSLDKPSPKDYLGASFFCSRDDEKLSRDHLIIPNLAYQLAQYDAGIHAGVTKSLKEDRNVVDLDIENQFQKLILEPLRSATTQRRLVVIVMDALDECSGKPEEIVALFSTPQMASLPFSVKLFVTGRPEAKIRQALARSNVKSQIQPLQLHEIEHSIVRGDIGIYLDHHFELMVEVHTHLSSGWPSKTDVEALGDLAGDLFIFAATAIKFLNNPEEDPEDKLTLILTNVHSRGQIDSLYKQVLDSAFDAGRDKSLLKDFRDVMGAIVCLKEPLTLRGLQTLLDLPRSSVRKVVTRLYSVVVTPDTDDENIRLIHPSFPDYLTDQRRCTEKQYFLDEPVLNAGIAGRALKCMLKELRRNICNLEDPMILNEDITDLPHRLSCHIPPHLRYACFHWASHLYSVKPTKNLLELLHSFAVTKLLAWLEVLILYGRLDLALSSIKLVSMWLSEHSLRSLNTVELLEQMYRFIEQFKKSISICAGNIYASALPFTPSCLLLDVYSHEKASSARIFTPIRLEWSPCLSMMKGHMGSVCSIALSPDGSKIVSGSSDKTVRIWDSTTSEAVATLKGHLSSITSMDFSSDGLHIVSGSEDNTASIWDAASGKFIVTVEVHSPITSVKFSPDEWCLVCGHQIGMSLWNWRTGTEITHFGLDIGYTTSVSFSPDGRRVVSGHRDQPIRFWDAITGRFLGAVDGDLGSVRSVVFSPDGKAIASGGSDGTVRIWDSGKVIVLRGHSDEVVSVAFSPDGSKIISGSLDKAVCIWNFTTSLVPTRFEGHSGGVNSVAFSPDGRIIFSGSMDGVIRTWDSANCGTPAIVSGHSTRDIPLAFSPDGTKVVSCKDRTLQIWDSTTGGTFTTLPGHLGNVTCVAFSPDSSSIVSGSQDNTTRVWDARSRKMIATFKRHTPPTSVIFSSDGGSIVIHEAEGVPIGWDWRSSAATVPATDYKENSARSTASVTLQDGWIISSQTQKRLCQIPDAFTRRVEISPYGSLAVLFDDSHTLHVLDLSNCQALRRSLAILSLVEVLFI
ncbi:YVTN repeat-like/Quino protein amine dehydrogenase [Serendipita vermifera]|nr:YVTN repeat-like/Quino protein amine dehydrogenase [Serendipita vermifera]